MNFDIGAGEGFGILVAVFVVYAIPIAIVIWVLKSIMQMRTKLDQIQARLDSLSSQLDARR